MDVWHFMHHTHGSASAIIAGSSTHNERIKRLWRDVYRCVSSHYYELFYELERQHELDPLNETDIYCLHFVFLPRIDKDILEFNESWNHHSVSTEHNQTPYQMIITGYINSPFVQQDSIPPQNNVLPLSLYTTQHVQVPRSKFVPCSTLLAQLNQNINCLEDCSDFGRSLYIAAIEIVGQHLQPSINCTCFMME